MVINSFPNGHILAAYNIGHIILKGVNNQTKMSSYLTKISTLTFPQTII